MILDMDLLVTCLNASFFLKFAMDWNGNIFLWKEFCYLNTSQRYMSHSHAIRFFLANKK